MTRVVALQDVDVCWNIDFGTVFEEDQQLRLVEVGYLRDNGG